MFHPVTVTSVEPYFILVTSFDVGQKGRNAKNLLAPPPTVLYSLAAATTLSAASKEGQAIEEGYKVGQVEVGLWFPGCTPILSSSVNLNTRNYFDFCYLLAHGNSNFDVTVRKFLFPE